MKYYFKKELNNGAIESIAEVYDGLKPRVGKGCFNQAWSIAEILRTYYENIKL